MPKNIVILLDGTSNGIEAQRTNVLRIYGCLKKNADQLVYYDPGVGTLGAEGSWSRTLQKTSEIWGLATGHGIDANVKEAYRFLVENYERSEDGQDRIYIFGFSRGAYTARMLAGFLHGIGLIERRNLNLLDYAYRAYKRIGEAENDNAFAEVRLFERILDPVRPSIRLLGLFDTVASVIEPGPGRWPQLKMHAWTSRNPSVEAVRHALALDERRRMFRDLKWPENKPFKENRFAKTDGVPQDAKEVWFRGVHGDIGGGYPESESALAKITLDWMISETGPMGLDYETRTVNRLVKGKGENSAYAAPDAFADGHDSMTSGWRVIEYLPLPTKTPDRSGLVLTRCQKRSVPSGARIHASVIARAEAEGSLPDRLPKEYTLEGDPADWVLPGQ